MAKAAGSIQFLDFTSTSKNLLKAAAELRVLVVDFWLSSAIAAAAAAVLLLLLVFFSNSKQKQTMEQAADGMKVPSTSPNSRNSSAKRIKTRKRQAVGKGGKFKTSKVSTSKTLTE